MNVRKTIKKISALATGAAMLGATVMGAVAYDLGDYPFPFVDDDGSFSGYIVVGSKGTNAAGLAQDMVGAVDIGASLQAAAKSPVAVSGGSVTVAGGEDYDEQVLNGAWTAVTLTDTKLTGFKDTTTDLNDEDIDYEDQLVIGTNALGLQTSASEEDFGEDIYLTVTEDLIEYRVLFNDYVNRTLVGTSSTTEELEFYFLGKWLTVQSIDSDELGMTVEASSEQFLEEGDSITVSDKKVTLVRVGDGSVIVEVDGQREVISSGSSQQFEDADDFEVEVQSIFYIEGASDNGANLKLGDDLTESAQDGQSAELFGEPSREQDAEWFWVIRFNETSGSQYVGLSHEISRTDLDCNDDSERCALAMGEALSLPNGYASIEFAAVEEPADPVTITVTIDDDGIDLDDDAGTTRSDVKGLVFSSDSGDDFTASSVDTEEIYVVDNSGTMEIWYKDGDDETFASSASYFDIKVDDDYIRVTPPADLDATVDSDLTVNVSAIDYWNMTSFGDGSKVDALYFFVDVDNDYFGTEDDEDSGELQYSSGADFTTTNIGAKDYVWVGDYGWQVSPDPESQFGSGQSFDLLVPTNQQKGTIVVTSSSSTVSVADDSGAYQVNMIPSGLAILDSDAESLLGEENLIVVGGPYVNSIAATLMGDPTPDQIMAMFEPGKAKIKLFEDNNAILVAGYSAQDTTGAARVLAEYWSDDYTLSGDEVEVVVPSLSDISLREPTLPSTADDVMADEEPEAEEEEMVEEEAEATE